MHSLHSRFVVPRFRRQTFDDLAWRQSFEVREPAAKPTGTSSRSASRTRRPPAPLRTSRSSTAALVPRCPGKDSLRKSASSAATIVASLGDAVRTFILLVAEIHDPERNEVRLTVECVAVRVHAGLEEERLPACSRAHPNAEAPPRRHPLAHLGVAATAGHEIRTCRPRHDVSSTTGVGFVAQR